MKALIDNQSIDAALRDGLPPVIAASIQARKDELADYIENDISEIVQFLIVEPGDPIDRIDAALGFSMLQNIVDGACFGSPGFEPSWEWIEDHGDWFEAVYILTDAGAGWVVFVANKDGTDAALLALCRAHIMTKLETNGTC